MGDKIKSLGHEMQRVIDLGMIDHWLRGLSDIIPRNLSTQTRDIAEEFNTYLMAFDCTDSIESTHIQNLTGCRQLLSGCAQQNIAVEIKFIDNGHLYVAFKPENAFAKSQIFGFSYKNVLPTLFGIGRGNK